jgi:LacI family transcriptional regulator
VLALQDLGVRVPEDVSVVGFDGLPHLKVPLTTVRQDFQAIARTALEVMRDNVHVRQHREGVLGTTLVHGQTSAAIR